MTAPVADPAKTAVALLLTTRPSDRALAGWLLPQALWFSGRDDAGPEAVAAWLEKGWG